MWLKHIEELVCDELLIYVQLSLICLNAYTAQDNKYYIYLSILRLTCEVIEGHQQQIVQSKLQSWPKNLPSTNSLQHKKLHQWNC